jgi:hypothetical protein
MLKKAVQQGRRRVRTGGVPQGYVEDSDEPRTKLADFFSILQGRELPGSERAAIEMNELRAWINPYPTVLQPQRGMADLADLDTRNIKVERLPLDVQAVLRDSPAPLYELRIVFGRPITGNHMDLAGAIDGFVHEIDVFQQSHIDGGDFSCVMATQNMIHLIQRRQVIVPCVITIADSQSFVRMHVEEGELGVGKLVRACDRGMQEPAPE